MNLGLPVLMLMVPAGLVSQRTLLEIQLGGMMEMKNSRAKSVVRGGSKSGVSQLACAFGVRR